MISCKCCKCVSVSGKVGWERCSVVQWFLVGTAARTCVIAARECEVMARWTRNCGRGGVTSVMGGTAETLASSLARGGAVCGTG